MRACARACALVLVRACAREGGMCARLLGYGPGRQFALGRLDVLPTRDLGIQKGFQARSPPTGSVKEMKTAQDRTRMMASLLNLSNQSGRAIMA